MLGLVIHLTEDGLKKDYLTSFVTVVSVYLSGVDHQYIWMSS